MHNNEKSILLMHDLLTFWKNWKQHFWEVISINSEAKMGVFPKKKMLTD